MVHIGSMVIAPLCTTKGPIITSLNRSAWCMSPSQPTLALPLDHTSRTYVCIYRTVQRSVSLHTLKLQSCSDLGPSYQYGTRARHQVHCQLSTSLHIDLDVTPTTLHRTHLTWRNANLEFIHATLAGTGVPWVTSPSSSPRRSSSNVLSFHMLQQNETGLVSKDCLC